jgi:hypothetical protein
VTPLKKGGTARPAGQIRQSQIVTTFGSYATAPISSDLVCCRMLSTLFMYLDWNDAGTWLDMAGASSSNG